MVSFGGVAPSLVSNANVSQFVVPLVGSASRMPLLEEGVSSQPCTTDAGMVNVYGTFFVGATSAILVPLSVVPLAPAVAHGESVAAWFQLTCPSFHALLSS